MNTDIHNKCFQQTSITFIFFAFDFSFTARQDYFTHFEPSQLLGGAKMGDPREKTPNQ